MKKKSDEEGVYSAWVAPSSKTGGALTDLDFSELDPPDAKKLRAAAEARKEQIRPYKTRLSADDLQARTD